MKIVGTGLIFLAGFVLGAALFQTRAVKAQTVKHVTVIPLVEGTPTAVVGDIIGFSCVPRSPRSMPPAACYIVTQ